MEQTKPVIHKSSLLAMIKGYKKVDELLRIEKMKRLNQLTHKNSLDGYNSLCAVWEGNFKKEGIENLEKKRISFLIERRKRFNRIGSLREKKNR
jgi:hypothetical protein